MIEPPRREHVMIYQHEPPKPPPRSVPGAGALLHLRVKAHLAELRDIEARRRDDQLQDAIDVVAARLDAIEHPDTDQPAPVAPLDQTVPHRGEGRTVALGDADWIIDGWRDHDWSGA